MLYLHQVIAQSTQTPDESDGRVYGWLPGVVTDVDTNLTQVKARLGKMDDGDSTHWLVPMGMGSVESLPEVGDPVGVVFMDGDPHAGAYFYYPQSTTNGRPTKEPIPLGLTSAGMYNDLATKLQALISKYNAAVTDLTAILTAINTTGLAVSGAVAKMASPVSQTSSADNDTIGKMKAADGSIVAAKSGDNITLSKRSKVR